MRLFPLLFALTACTGPSGPPGAGLPTSSSTLAITADDRTLWVVTPDADSVSAIDLQTRTLRAEVALGPVTPAVDADGRFEPIIKPRALALLPGDRTLYVAGQAANQILVVDAQAFAVRAAIPVGAEPTAVVAAADGRRCTP